MGNVTTHASICHVCHARCPITVDVEDGKKVLKVTGNKESPLYHAFCCSRGQAMPEQLHSPDRLLRPIKRNADGSFAPIAASKVSAEIADKIKAIVDKHGPNAVALYYGTYSGIHPAATPMAAAFMQALGSTSICHSGSIDQPGKDFALALLGKWEAGLQDFIDPDVWMFIGANPLVSIGIAMPNHNPAHYLTEALRKGMKLIVIDPRETETARRAHVHLQTRPGNDAVLVAAMLNVILSENLHDKAFTDQNVGNLDTLRTAVAPFTPAYAAQRADVPAEKIIEAARIFAAARRGLAAGSTGANMSGRSTLTEYLILALNTVCGRFNREGEPIPNPGVFLTPAHPRAQPVPPSQALFPDVKTFARGLSFSVIGMPASVLAEEVLSGKIRALISMGGNPAAAFPDQKLSIQALENLELSVQIDIKMSASAKLAHYVIPPTMAPETFTTSYSVELLEMIYSGFGLCQPFGMTAGPIVARPEGSDLLEEWEFFYDMARRMGLQLTLSPMNSMSGCRREERPPFTLDMTKRPTSDELIESLLKGSRIPLAEVKKHPNGAIFAGNVLAAPRDPGCTARLDVGNPAMMTELAEVFAESQRAPQNFTYIGRRMPHVYNSSCRDLPSLIRKGGTYNPAYMHPDDLKSLGLASGDVVKITSPHGEVFGIVEADPTLRRGIVSMSHSFGDIPRDSADFRKVGSNTSQLTSVVDDFDRYSGIPRMSSIPVSVTPTNY